MIRSGFGFLESALKIVHFEEYFCHLVAERIGRIVLHPLGVTDVDYTVFAVDHDAGGASALRKSKALVEILQQAAGFACMFAPRGLLLTLLPALPRKKKDPDQDDNNDQQNQQGHVTGSKMSTALTLCELSSRRQGHQLRTGPPCA